MVKKLREANGDTTVTEEAEIINSFEELAKNGFLVEPSSAVAYAALKKQRDEGIVSSKDRVVVVLTGSGLKTTFGLH